MSMQKSINAAIASVAGAIYGGKTSKLDKETNKVKKEAKKAKSTTEITMGKEGEKITLTSKVVNPKTPLQKKAFDAAAKQEAKYRLGMEERPAQKPAPSYISGGITGNKITDLTPREKAIARLDQNFADKAIQNAEREERKEILKNPEAAGEKIVKEQMNAMTTAAPQEKEEEEKAKEPEKKEEEAKTEEKKEEEAVRVRKEEISASEAKKLIAETEAREKQKKEEEEKAKKALEGGNK